MRHRLIVSLLMLILATVAVQAHSLALGPSSASNITVRPFLQELKINPGDTSKDFQLSLSNDSNFTQVFHLVAVNFGSLNETGGLAFEGANANDLARKYGLSKWLSLEQNNVELGPNQQTTIKVTINNDKNLAPGAHYAAIITTASKPAQTAGQLTITPKVSSLIFATKLGGELYNIHLSSMSANGNLWQLPTTVNLRIKSTGNTYIVPRGIVSVKQNNKVLSRGVINQQSSIVLPETVRDFDVNLAKQAPLKNGFLRTSYRVQVDYRYDGVSQYATQSANYTLYNRTSIILIILVIFVVLLGFKYHSKLYGMAHNLR